MLTLKQIEKVSIFMGQTDEYARREAERQLIKRAADEEAKASAVSSERNLQEIKETA